MGILQHIVSCRSSGSLILLCFHMDCSLLCWDKRVLVLMWIAECVSCFGRMVGFRMFLPMSMGLLFLSFPFFFSVLNFMLTSFSPLIRFISRLLWMKLFLLFLYQCIWHWLGRLLTLSLALCPDTWLKVFVDSQGHLRKDSDHLQLSRLRHLSFLFMFFLIAFLVLYFNYYFLYNIEYVWRKCIPFSSWFNGKLEVFTI